MKSEHPSPDVADAVREGQKAIDLFDRRMPKRFRQLEKLGSDDICDPFPNEEVTGQYDVPDLRQHA